MEKLLGCLLAIIAWFLGLGISWALTCALIYLITACFSWTFSWTIATGVWLIACLIGLIFG